MSVSEKIKRIPWKEYLSKQVAKVFVFVLLTFLLISIMLISFEIEDLSVSAYGTTEYIFAAILSSLCFFIVLIAFSKVVLFDLANDFGMRDESGKMIYGKRFWLFTMLALSFCSAIYLLLDVLLQDVYLQLFPVMMMRIVLDYLNMDIPGLTDIDGREFYQTARNLYFGFFFILIILFSVIVFLAILTTFARRRVVKKFSKEEEEVLEEKEGIRTIYKIFAWLLIPYLIFFVIALQDSPIAPLFTIGYVLAVIWWFYQLLKVVFLIIWRGVKITAFITSVNLLVIIPLIFVLWILPAILWGAWNSRSVLLNEIISIPDIINAFLNNFITYLFSFQDLIQLDFVIITVIATIIVGFAEGFAIIAIFTALSRGIEVARTGQVLTRSPPKVMVLSKYLVMFSVWASLLWDSLADIFQMLTHSFNIPLPPIPDFFYTFYHNVLIPLSDWIASFWPSLQFTLFILILPIYFIFSGAFKFLSVTLITPRIKDRGEMFFLLISTAFVLILTNILQDIYDIQLAAGYTGIVDAPLITLGATELFSFGVYIFENVEAIAFYGGFFFGIVWVISRAFRKPTTAPAISKTVEYAPTKTKPYKEMLKAEEEPITESISEEEEEIESESEIFESVVTDDSEIDESSAADDSEI